LVLVEQKEPKKNTVKPTSTKTKGTRRAGKDDINTDDLTAFLIAIFNLLGGLLGSHWFIQEYEAEQISEPLTRILNKMNKKRKTKVNELTAPLLLFTAISTIVIPRLTITVMEWKEKANERKRNQSKRTQFRPNSEQAPSVSRGMDREAPRDHDEQPSGGHDGENAPQHTPSVPTEIIGLFGE
jgi:hypothetical protein